MLIAQQSRTNFANSQRLWPKRAQGIFKHSNRLGYCCTSYTFQLLVKLQGVRVGYESVGGKVCKWEKIEKAGGVTSGRSSQDDNLGTCRSILSSNLSLPFHSSAFTFKIPTNLGPASSHLFISLLFLFIFSFSASCKKTRYCCS